MKTKFNDVSMAKIASECPMKRGSSGQLMMTPGKWIKYVRLMSVFFCKIHIGDILHLAR